MDSLCPPVLGAVPAGFPPSVSPLTPPGRGAGGEGAAPWLSDIGDRRSARRRSGCWGVASVATADSCRSCRQQEFLLRTDIHRSLQGEGTYEIIGLIGAPSVMGLDRTSGLGVHAGPRLHGSQAVRPSYPRLPDPGWSGAVVRSAQLAGRDGFPLLDGEGHPAELSRPGEVAIPKRRVIR